MNKNYAHGPRRCPLCKVCGENINRLFIQCSYVREMWNYVAHVSSIQFIWDSQNLDEDLANWVNNKEFTGI